ncbi:MAG TPA: response regulator, partial [Planctomycetota bacterium]|nr:response regulator [Planctomycetota bacterium]
MPSSESSAGKILYVEDDVATARLVKALAEKDGHVLRILPSGRDFLKRVGEDPPDLCLIDLHLPDASGLELLKQLRDKHPGIPAIVVTGSEAVEDAVASMKAGALDYVTKPPDAARLSVSLRNGLRAVQRDREIERLRSEVVEDHRPESLVGASAPMEAVRNLIRKIAPSEATVLIQGENGTGKELVA